MGKTCHTCFYFFISSYLGLEDLILWAVRIIILVVLGWGRLFPSLGMCEGPGGYVVPGKWGQISSSPETKSSADFLSLSLQRNRLVAASVPSLGIWAEAGNPRPRF